MFKYISLVVCVLLGLQTFHISAKTWAIEDSNYPLQQIEKMFDLLNKNQSLYKGLDGKVKNQIANQIYQRRRNEENLTKKMVFASAMSYWINTANIVSVAIEKEVINGTSSIYKMINLGPTSWCDHETVLVTEKNFDHTLVTDSDGLGYFDMLHKVYPSQEFAEKSVLFKKDDDTQAIRKIYYENIFGPVVVERLCKEDNVLYQIPDVGLSQWFFYVPEGLKDLVRKTLEQNDINAFIEIAKIAKKGGIPLTPSLLSSIIHKELLTQKFMNGRLSLARESSPDTDGYMISYTEKNANGIWEQRRYPFYSMQECGINVEKCEAEILSTIANFLSGHNGNTKLSDRLQRFLGQIGK